MLLREFTLRRSEHTKWMELDANGYLAGLIALFLLVVMETDGAALSEEKRLIKHLLDHYQKVGIVGRPVHNTTETITVTYGMALIQILDLDEKNQVLTTNVWSRYTWQDILLEWKPSDFGNVQQVRVPADNIWTPDIVLYNYADDRLKEQRDAFAVVNNDGSLLWIPQAIFKSSCVIDITHFPFDEQTCHLKFGSWSYDGFKLDIEFYANLSAVDLNDYIESNEWAVLEHSARKNVQRYPCCDEPYPDLTFTLKLRRKVAFYNYILILPCVLLSSLTLVLFWLPPESPAKMVLGMNIFVAFFVLLLLLAESTPPAASSIPLIGAYYCLNMIMITLSTFLSVIVINLYFRGDKKNRVPHWLKRLFIDFLARALCMREGLLPADYEGNEDRYRPPETIPVAKESKHKKRLKKQADMQCNKFQMYDLNEAAVTHAAALQNHNRDSNVPDKSPVYSQQSVECDIRDIRRFLKQLLMRVQQKEERARNSLEWRIVALVLDRIFFFTYLSAIIISLATIFPKTA